MPSYDPVKKCETATVLRQLNVESAAKRRNFRIEERQRLSNLTEVKTEIKRFEKEKVKFLSKLFQTQLLCFRLSILHNGLIMLPVQPPPLPMWMKMTRISLHL